jgi:hypothetical protein
MIPNGIVTFVRWRAFPPPGLSKESTMQSDHTAKPDAAAAEN